ncbi:MAG: VOC family protein [Ferrimicrobium sp.]
MDFPRIEIGIDCQDLMGLAVFWAAALGYRVGDLDQEGVYLDLVPPDSSSPVVYFQRVSERKSTKNRLHLDLFVEDTAGTVDALCGRGAHTVGEPMTGSEGGWWQVMADPEENEFCVCQEYGDRL